MKRIVLAAAVGLCGAGSADAQVRREPTPHQQLATTCDYEADQRGWQGQERAAFVRKCLAEGRRRQQEVLHACQLQALRIAPLERRAFMAECARR